ncbi:MAG: neutral zinc metallopeptidase [Actinomycetes bacterium]
MSFNEGVRIDPGRASGGRGAGLAIGGGAGGILMLVLALVFGVNPGDLVGGGAPAPGAQEQGGDFGHCRTGADANEHVDCRIIATAESLDAVWAEQLPAATGGRTAYSAPGLVIFEQQVSTGCGAASSAVGPFYCPADTTTYFDTGFFDVLRERLGAGDGPLAEMYVVAHEFGHHIENQLGFLDAAQQDPQGPESGAVRVELMADCLAGVWAHHATQAVDPESGQAFLEPLTQQDIADALSAASAVGDDRIQQQAQGQVNPETWTHGSSEQRQRWFSTGYESGQAAACDTFSTDDL